MGDPTASAGGVNAMTFTPEIALNPIARHPCYGADAHNRFGRIHVPVAPRCNIQCNYCLRRFDCANENRPGVTTRVLTPDQAMVTVATAVERDSRMAVLGIAGPGDALANEATFETLDRARREYPYLTRCVSTNGLLLRERLDDLERVGVAALTITINAVEPSIGERIYSRVRYRGQTHRGREAFTILANNQLEGLRQAARRGMTVKVNSVLIPGVNDCHLWEVARVVKRLGAAIHNIIPLIPLARFADLAPPTDAAVADVRTACASVISQFDSCLRCRADAVGVPGEEGCSAASAGGVLRTGVTV